MNRFTFKKEELFKYKPELDNISRFMDEDSELFYDLGEEGFPSHIRPVDFCDFAMKAINHQFNHDVFYQDTYMADLLSKANYYAVSRAMALIVNSDYFDIKVSNVKDGYPKTKTKKELISYLMEEMEEIL